MKYERHTASRRKFVRKLRGKQQLTLTLSELDMLAQALNAYVYWELAFDFPSSKRDGEVVNIDKIEDQLLREIAQQAQALEERLYKLSRRER